MWSMCRCNGGVVFETVNCLLHKWKISVGLPKHADRLKNCSHVMQILFVTLSVHPDCKDICSGLQADMHMQINSNDT